MKSPILCLYALILCIWFNTIESTSGQEVTFNYTGLPKNWIVPNGVTSVSVDVRGAQGGGNGPSLPGGKGGRVQTTLAVTPGETLSIYVGGKGGDPIGPDTGGAGGWNGGGAGGIDDVDGNGPAGGGGGASDIRRGGNGLGSRVVVAGGGGGTECCYDGYGGDGGEIGATGTGSGGSLIGGAGGTQTAGGAGGIGCDGNGGSGSLGQGGVGGDGNRAGGGGGGGYYGGGGGGGCGYGSGGGGGSSYSSGMGTIHTQGYQVGDGQVILLFGSAVSVLQPGPTDSQDIWTTSVYSYAPGGSVPGGGLNDERLRVGGWSDLYYSLLQFDVAGLPPNATSALLHLYCYSQSGGGTPMFLDRITQPWDWRTQGTGRDRERLWWADRPSAMPWSAGQIPVPTQGQWCVVDITDLYNGWKDGRFPNYGVQFRPVYNFNNNFNEFYSADFGGDPTLRPKLVITGGTQQIMPPTRLYGQVVETDLFGRGRGPLAGATVTVAGIGAQVTDGEGRFQFAGLNPSAFAVTVIKSGYLSVTRTVNVAAGETKHETFRLAAPAPGSTMPTAHDVASPNGRHLIEGTPGNLSFSSTVVWNGSPGTVRYKVAGAWYVAALTDLVDGMARATVSVAAPTFIPGCSELMLEVINGEGQTRYVNAGFHFHPIPGIIIPWYRDNLPWTPSGLTLSYADEQSWTVWDAEIPSGILSSKAEVGYRRELSYDALAGTFGGTLGGFGALKLELDVSQVELLGEGRLDFAGNLDIAFAGCDAPSITPGWAVSMSGKPGIGAPAVLMVDAVFPPAAPVIHYLLTVPLVKDILGALKLRLYLVPGLDVSGQYSDFSGGNCFLGTTSLNLAGTMGLEGQAALEVGDAEVGIYVGGTGTPELQACPSWEFQGLTLRAYVGVFASVWLFDFSREIAADVRFGGKGQQRLEPASSTLPIDPNGQWRPIGDRILRWGVANHLTDSYGRLQFQPASPGGVAGFTSGTLLENVTRLARPSAFADSSEALVLFGLYDPQKPSFAATDIGTVRQLGAGAWASGRIIDDQVADFSPIVTGVNSNWLLAAWTRVAGDVSGATNPVQIAPHLEIVASWFDRIAGTWSAPAQLTANTVVDRNPVPVGYGTTQGILWIQNEGEASVGDSSNGDQLLFARWSGADWEEPQVLWAGNNGILSFASLEDGAGEGYIVLTVDEDGNLDTREDRELHGLFTVGGVWQPTVRLTSDAVEDALPTLVSPNGVPLCVWSTSNTLAYTALNVWNPRPVFGASTLANQAPSLDGVTLPGGAAVAYAVQGSEGVDIVASFYDANIDQWSLPRQLTHDEHVESALSLASDGTNIVMAYLKTQTVRTNVTVEINGQTYPLENIPQPGRTDLALLCHALGNDLAVVSGSLTLDPPNPAPRSNATLRATIENCGDHPLQNIHVAFYDGNPAFGGTLIGTALTIVGPMIGGATQQLSVVWTVPARTNAHDVFVSVDPLLALEDRDRANNTASMRTVLPDLTIETCWSEEVSRTNVLLAARTVNIGVMPAESFELSWRLGSVNGEEIGRTVVNSMAAGQTNEVTFLWDTSGRYFTEAFVPVFAVMDVGGVVSEWSEVNNDYGQTVRVVPGWVPRVVDVRVLGGTNTVLTFKADGYAASEFTVESTTSLATPDSWGVEASAAVTTNAIGRFEALVPLQSETRFYRVVAP